LSEEGWPISRWAPGWFQSRNPEDYAEEPPSRDPLRDPAALLSQEGSLSL